MRQKLPAIILFLISLVVVFTNYRSGTWLTGWDNLHPELNFPLNIQRSVFSVWQEYQGLGLLGGMGHASDILRQGFLFVLSFIFDARFLRYICTFLMLIIGPLGVYKLSGLFLGKKEDHKNDWAAFLAGLFYLLNLATVQVFYVPFEAFITHYGFLPWLFYIAVLYFRNGGKKYMMLLFLVNLLSLTQGYVPTIFAVYLISLFIFFVFNFIHDKKFSFMKRIWNIFLIVLIANAFWLMPFLYFTLTSANIVGAAHENFMATEDIYLRNKEFGTIADVSILKGFWFKFVDMDLNRNFNYMALPWRDYLSSPFILGIGYLLFTVVLLGVYHQIKKRNNFSLGLIILFLFSIAMLAIDTPPFNYLSIFLRDFIPLFNQVFRVPFTKFAILAAFIYSILFGFGVSVIISWIQNYTKKAHVYISIIISLLIIVFTFPIFRGYLLYDFVKLKIPQEYFDTISFFNQQDHDTRVANFPQFTYWGWNQFLWGDRGSGFIWYGIPQPILDRAFDGYSGYDENYYWEISQAIYSNNSKLLAGLLQKYQIKWLIVDGNLISFVSQKAIYTDKLEQMITNLSEVNLIKTFGKIKIYEVSLNTASKNFVFLAEDLPVVGPVYKWGNYDKAYEEYGNYISLPGGTGFFEKSDVHQEKNDQKQSVRYPDFNIYISPINHNESLSNIIGSVYAQDNTHDTVSSTIRGVHAATSEVSSPDIYYPFRSLFTGRQQSELEFNVEDKSDYFSFKTKIPKELINYKLVIPNLYEDEVTELDESDLSKKTVKAPQVYLDRELISVPSTSEEPELRRLSLSPSEVSLLLPYIREGNLEIRVPKINGYYSFNQQSAISNQQLKSCDQFNNGIYTHDKITEGSNELLRLTSIGSSNCLDFDLPNLSQDLGYLVTVENRNIEGKSLLFSVINKNSQRADIETYLPKRSSTPSTSEESGLSLRSSLPPSEVSKSYFIIPPMEQYGLGYTLHLDNISIGRVKTVNDLGKITVNPIPYRFLTGLKVIKGTDQLPITNYQLPINVEHPNPSLYKISIDNQQLAINNNQTLVLSQSFDSGWKAYSNNKQQSTIINYLFPFWSGKEIKDHVLVNNWENGWMLNYEAMKQCNNEQCNIIIVYLPQYLEYIGFILLGIGVLIIIFYPRDTTNHQLPASTQRCKPTTN